MQATFGEDVYYSDSYILLKLLQKGLENRGQVYFWKSAHLKNVHLKVY